MNIMNNNIQFGCIFIRMFILVSLHKYYQYLDTDNNKYYQLIIICNIRYMEIPC